MSNPSRVDNISERDKLWELYIHVLGGYHANIGANRKGNTTIAENALTAAKAALAVWDESE